ncbi:helix-turn-helix domain-containing protein [Oceanirhabdus seepicola]|uniref:Helix-turn-helix transcriptional regulator n=1 Tax=Oceanirhabdus seepicola TaxID=2828781 RepID=A0A9J6NXU7_9CLOT|nr:helix-turn-helix transcriptional regulator [Oceanirhabdus seepicola]MCM1989335.1 helix-turn-helix transcriptional regulator [Oceanirhabdus seepicola]
MQGSVLIFGENFEYDFLSAWIKYNRLENGYSQDSLCHGVCSPSHLSYFENGKKKLNSEIIELLLHRMNIDRIPIIENIGSIRQELINFITELEFRNITSAKRIFNGILKYEDLIKISPYNIEFKIYKLAYDIHIDRKNYTDLKKDISYIDNIYSALNDDLRYLYLLLTGRLTYKYISHIEGLTRLENAKAIKDTPWVNYNLGFCYCYDKQSLRGIISMEKALETYQHLGQYVCAMYCNIYLGICYTDLQMYDEALNHLKATYTAANHFKIDSVLTQAYVHLSNMYMYLQDYTESLHWAQLALIGDFSVLAAVNCTECLNKLNRLEECKDIFDRFLISEKKDSLYYNLLYFNYLSIFHFDEDIFYQETIKNILPYYESINYSNICDIINKKLIEYFEKNRKYKDANKLYRKLLENK